MYLYYLPIRLYKIDINMTRVASIMDATRVIIIGIYYYLSVEATVTLKHGLAIVVCLFLIDLTTHDAVSNRCGAIERTECTYNHTEDHGECERTDRVAAKEENAEEHEQCGERCHYRTAQCLVQRLVEGLVTILFRIHLHHLTDSVEHNHCIIDLITDDGQYRSDKRLVDLH